MRERKGREDGRERKGGRVREGEEGRGGVEARREEERHLSTGRDNNCVFENVVSPSRHACRICSLTTECVLLLTRQGMHAHCNNPTLTP